MKKKSKNTKDSKKVDSNQITKKDNSDIKLPENLMPTSKLDIDPNEMKFELEDVDQRKIM